MTDIETKSKNAQISLMADVITNYGHIVFDVEHCATDVIELLKQRQCDKEGKVCSISKETIDAAIDKLLTLSKRSKWEKLGILSKTAVPDNETKRKILQMLQ